MDMRFSGSAAATSLSRAAYDPKKLAAIHTGAALALSLVLTVLNFVINRGIDSTGGLANFGNRAVLSTLQSVLSLAGNLALPFWEVGFLYAALGWAQSREVTTADLWEGFRRMGIVARLYLLLAGIFMLVIFSSLEIASVLFSFTPFFESTLTNMQAVIDQATAAGQTTIDAAMLEQLLPSMVPIYILFFIVLIVIMIPLTYRLRMAMFAAMDDAPGARKAIGASVRMTRRNCFDLFRVDLRFWWFYLGQLLIAGVAYLDALLPALGIQLPIHEDILFFVCYGLYLALQLVFAWHFQAKVQTTYAHCYLALKAATAPPPTPQMPQYPNWQGPQP